MQRSWRESAARDPRRGDAQKARHIRSQARRRRVYTAKERANSTSSNPLVGNIQSN